VLLWALARAEPGVQGWRFHQRILEHLPASLTKRGSMEEEAKRAIASLTRIQSLLAAIQREGNEQARAELSRGLEITMQQLAPG
jgi:hypothetical protein